MKPRIASQQQQLEIEQEEVLRAQRQTRDQEAGGSALEREEEDLGFRV